VAVGDVASSPLRPITSSVRGEIQVAHDAPFSLRRRTAAVVTHGGCRRLPLSPSTPTGGGRRELGMQWWPDGRRPRRGVVTPCRLFRRVVFFFIVLIVVRERVRCAAKVPFFAVHPIPAARQSPLDVVSSGASSVTPVVPSVTFVCHAPHVMHGKVCSPCVIEEGARQREFTVQKATVCPLLCTSTKYARQSLCRAFSSLCRAPETHGKARVTRSAI
jgi:hypothetical protein